ncbi:MAG TPA: glycosyltransferase family 39 protein [candidate division Zixibacteria bacterium]|nr:glycosyltransferase family 39 protein [candidate division Zixibacteria bacterium]
MQIEQQGAYRHIAVLIVVLSGLLSALYSVVTPMWEAPDEIGHFLFARELTTSKRLPVQEIGDLGEAHQPPLYYALAALLSLPVDQSINVGALRLNPNFIWSGGDQVNISLHHTDETFPYQGQALGMHLARLASSLMGMVTVALTIAIAWLVFPKQPWIGLIAAALIAFNPQFLFIHGSVNNDALLVMASTGIIWQTLRTEKRPQVLGQWLLLGLWIAVGLLAKLGGVSIAVVCILYLAWIGIRGGSYRQLAKGILAAGVVVVVLAGWWFVRNQILYGDPLGWSVYNEVFAANFRDTPLTWSDVREFLRVQYRSFWGVFGWMTVFAPGWFYVFTGLLTLTGIAGIVLSFISGKWRQLGSRQKRTFILLVGLVLVQELFIFWSINRFNETWYQGRYLFPAIAAIAILLAYGLETLISTLSHRKQLGARAVLLASMMGLAIYMAFGIIKPAYQSITLPKSSIWFLPDRLNVLFGDQISLKGYRIDRDEEASSLLLKLYWQAERTPELDYSAFVHLTDNEGKLIDQDDGSPGEDQRYPPSSWLPGDIVEDWRRVTIPTGIETPLEIRLGLYNWMDGQRLPAASVGNPLGDSITIYLEEP